jgi:hypothetical protein
LLDTASATPALSANTSTKEAQMGTTTLTQARTLRSSGSPLSGREILMLRGSHEVALTPNGTPSTVSDLVERWLEISHDPTMPIDVLRRELRLSLYGEAPDFRTECAWQRLADQDLADAVSDDVVRLVRSSKRGRR